MPVVSCSGLVAPYRAILLRPEPPFTGVSGPSGPEIAKKSQKRSFWGSAEKSQKIPGQSKNTDFRTFLGIFRFFRVFSGTFLRTPKRTFLRLFCDFGPGGSGDSCKWRLGAQRYCDTIAAIPHIVRYFLREVRTPPKWCDTPPPPGT